MGTDTEAEAQLSGLLLDLTTPGPCTATTASELGFVIFKEAPSLMGPSEPLMGPYGQEEPAPPVALRPGKPGPPRGTAQRPRRDSRVSGSRA